MEVAGIYDNGPISPVAKINENLAIFFDKAYRFYRIEFIEGIPESSPFVIDLVAIANQVNIAAGQNIQKQAIQVLLMNENELLHLRWEPLDDIEGQLWQLPSQSRYSPKGGQATVSPFTRDHDPYLATTTFFILGQNKDPQIGAFNPEAIAQPTARFAFWGYRYILSPLAVGGSVPMATYLPIAGR